MIKNVTVSVFGLTLGLVVIALVPGHAGRDGYSALTNIQSPAFFPLVLAGCLVLVSLAFLLTTLIGRRWVRANSDVPVDHPVEAPSRLVLTMFMIAAYYFMLTWIGMIAASGIVILVLGLILGYRRIWILIAVSLALPLGVHLLFRRLLYVLLPEGRLF